MTKIVKTFFTLSILLNVLLIGVGAGFAFKSFHHSPWEQAQKDLSPESRDLMKQSFTQMREEMAPLIEQVKQARGEMKKILAEDNFDAKKFDQMGTKIQGLRMQMSSKFMETSKKFASTVSPAERKALADKLVGDDGKRKKSGFWSCPHGGFFGPPMPPPRR